MPKKLTTETFIEKAKEVHKEENYIYDKVDYKNIRTSVIITCPIHGDWKTTPTRHLSGRICHKCGKLKASKSTLKGLEYFLEKSNSIFNGFFNYDLVTFRTLSNHVTIICPNHGSFTQRAAHHIQGHNGCKGCIAELNTTNTFSRTGWINFCKDKGVEYPICYITKLGKDNEEFVKIGLTSNTTEDRMFRIWQYNTETLNEIIGKPERVYDLEKKLHKAFKQYQYFPEKKFSGYTECFNLSILKDPNFQLFLQK